MSDKGLVTLGVFIGSLVGGYLPVLFGVSFLSFISVVTSAIGALVGIYIAYKLSS